MPVDEQAHIQPPISGMNQQLINRVENMRKCMRTLNAGHVHVPSTTIYISTGTSNLVVQQLCSVE